jgi:hypothetical protein
MIAAVIVPIIVIVVIALMFGMYLAYRRRHRSIKPAKQADDKIGELTAELPTQSSYAELPTSQRSFVELAIPDDCTNCPQA